MANMPVSTTLNTRQKQYCTGSFTDFDGNLDTTTAIALSASNPSLSTLTFEPGGRILKIYPLLTGSQTIQLSAGTQTNTIQLTITSPPDLGHLDLVLGPISNKP